MLSLRIAATALATISSTASSRSDSSFSVVKVSPESIACETCNGFESGDEFIFPDEMSRNLSKSSSFKTAFYDVGLV